MQLPQPQARLFNNIVGDINAGRVLIPQFQREFVWNMKKSAQLIDSILKGYPIGTFIFWHTNERLRAVRSIGGQLFPKVGEHDPVDFVLDGQQRLTSLYACIYGCEVERENGQIDDFKNIVVDLCASGDEQIVWADASKLESDRCISVSELHKGQSTVFRKFSEDLHSRIDEYRVRITAYQYSVIQLSRVPLGVATDVFTRINTTGKSLDMFEIMVAKTYDEKEGFDLLEKWVELKDSLGDANYETVAPVTALRTVALIADQNCKKEHILDMPKKDFISNWDKARDAIERAVDHLRSTGLAPVSRLLPYDSLVVSFAYFFSRQRMATPRQTELLEDFFWRVAFTSRYSSSVESKLAEDIGHMESFLGEEESDYGHGWGVSTSPDYIINNGGFATGRAYIKAILCLYARQKPRSFNNHSREVIIDNSWLKQINSKNYHHFFPRSFLKGQKVEKEKANHILNITIVDDFLNKNIIGARSPSEYMDKFRAENSQLADTMRTHLIPDLDGFGVFENDYDKFLKQRAKIVSEKLSKKIIPNRMDGERQPDLDDYEENAE